MFSFKLENESGNIVDINDGQRYEVVSFSGLNPPTASLFTSKSPNRKGIKYNGSTLDERTVIVNIKILGDIEKNRNDLYPWIDTEQYCKIRYQNGIKSVYCEGYVTDCPIDLCTDNEVISLAVVCPDPYLKEFTDILTDISSLLKQFTFPFAIAHESTVSVKSKNLYIREDGTEEYREDATATMNRGVPFSTIRESNITNVFNTGAETGVKITVKCNADIKNLVIFDASNTSRQFALRTTLYKGEVMIIDTEASPKTCKRYRPDGTAENLIKYTVPVPTWFTLKKGSNLFAYRADTGETSAEITVGYTNKYLGV